MELVYRYLENNSCYCNAMHYDPTGFLDCFLICQIFVLNNCVFGELRELCAKLLGQYPWRNNLSKLTSFDPIFQFPHSAMETNYIFSVDWQIGPPGWGWQGSRGMGCGIYLDIQDYFKFIWEDRNGWKCNFQIVSRLVHWGRRGGWWGSEATSISPPLPSTTTATNGHLIQTKPFYKTSPQAKPHRPSLLWQF